MQHPLGFEIETVEPVIGSEIRGLDLSKPLTPEVMAFIRQAIVDRIVLVFKDQGHVSPQQFIGFVRQFGQDLEIHELSQYNHPDVPEIFVISNIVENGKPIGAPKVGLNWHTDHYHREKPALFTFLHGHEIPPAGGHTTYVNGYAAYEALPDSLKQRIDGLMGLHSRVRMMKQLFPDATDAEIEQERSLFPDIRHPIVRTNPETGKKALYLGGEAGSVIDGLPDAEGEALFRELLEFLIQPQFRYVHKWQTGDVILSDQRGSMHRATEWDEGAHRRLVHRATVFDTAVPA